MSLCGLQQAGSVKSVADGLRSLERGIDGAATILSVVADGIRATPRRNLNRREIVRDLDNLHGYLRDLADRADPRPAAPIQTKEKPMPADDSRHPFGKLKGQLDDLRKTGDEVTSVKVEMALLASRLRHEGEAGKLDHAEAADALELLCSRLTILCG